MSSFPFQQLVCPFCASPFVTTERILTCVNGHAFDLAREGYVNFLRKKLPGDTREMLLARRNVFAQGHYLPLSDTINELICADLLKSYHQAQSASILDAGCGEGYYLRRLQTALAAHGVRASYLGLDISKEGVRMAAKSGQEAFFIVANLKERLALTDACQQVILNVFAPRNPAEFARVLAPGGLLLVVIPAPTHLHQLRTALSLLTIEEQKQQHVIEQFVGSGQFRLEKTTPVTYELFLQQDEIAQLVTMTPNYWHLTEETLQAMAEIAQLRTEVACVCLEFRRQDALR